MGNPWVGERAAAASPTRASEGTSLRYGMVSLHSRNHPGGVVSVSVSVLGAGRALVPAVRVGLAAGNART